jgi:hypothetical protein
MSGLFDSGNDVLSKLSVIHQTLELRNVPLVQQMVLSSYNSTLRSDYYSGRGRGTSGDEIGHEVQDISQDDWSFVPVPSNLGDLVSTQHKSSTFRSDRSSANSDGPNVCNSCSLGLQYC